MINHQIKVEVVEVKTESGVCPGMAKARLGESYVLGARTPRGQGMCTNAFNTVYPMSLAMRLTDKMSWEKKDYFDITCPHGQVVYRLSRVREEADASSKYS